MTRASKREHDVWASLNNGTEWNFDDILPYYIKVSTAIQTSTPAETFVLMQHETYETPSRNYSDRAGGIVVDSDNHGSSGPIHYAYAGYLYNQIGSWIRTFRNLGVPTGDPASGVTTGAYLSTSAIRGSDQTRSYSRTGYFETRPGNVRILTGYQVSRVNFNTSGSTPTATGVSFRQSRDGQAYTSAARREVILSAGVIGSPRMSCSYLLEHFLTIL
jgi:choline dehydrogenase-like flavoprotein